MGTLGNAMMTEASWTKTWNVADALDTTFDKCLDLFGRAGAMREASVRDKQSLFAEAFDENPLVALRLLFYIRDVRGGYGERDTFTDMLQWLANEKPELVNSNLWAILEYGRAKDLYSLIGTKAEDYMWKFIAAQFELDRRRMNSGESISLLAKWIATPDASSKRTSALGKRTALAIGYDFRHMKEYKKILREMRRYLDIPEAKMCAGKWSEIEYSKLASQCLIKHRRAFARHDEEGYSAFINKAKTGEVNMNTGAMTPCDIIRDVRMRYTNDLDVMWQNLENYCKGNALVMCDTSGSMTWGSGSMLPIDVAVALSMYFAERNEGDLKDLFMTFESIPHIVKIKGHDLKMKYDNILRADWGGSTNLEAAFMELLRICKDNKVSAEEMPDAIVVVSDMQINECSRDVNRENKLTFYADMKERYKDAGYTIPHLVFWNVNAVNPTFHTAKSDAGVSLVSGYSPAVFKAVMDNIGTTPLELMMSIVNSERYSSIVI